MTQIHTVRFMNIKQLFRELLTFLPYPIYWKENQPVLFRILLFRYCSQPEGDTNIINPYSAFSPAGDVTHFSSYFTIFQSSPFLTLPLTFHQLLFQIAASLISVLLATFLRNSKTWHLLHRQHLYQELYVSVSLILY